MPQARNTGTKLLLGAAAGLLVGAAVLWIGPWSGGEPVGSGEIVTRTSGSAEGPTGPVGDLTGVAGEQVRIAEALSPRALAEQAAARARARAEREAPRFQLTGSVVGPGGEPIPGAQVLVTTRRSETALGMELTERDLAGVCFVETDAGGRFGVGADDSTPELQKGRTVSALVRAPGWAVQPVRLGRFPSLLPMVVEPISLTPGISVAGRVLGPDGLPVHGATVYFGQASPLGGFRVSTPSRGYTLGVTPEDGAFRCDELAPGPFHLVVEKPGHPMARYEGEVSVGRGLEGVVVRLDRGGSIGGVVEAKGTSPDELWVSIWPADRDAPDVDRRPRAVRPRADGRFEVLGLRPAARYRLTVGPNETPRSSMDAESVVARCGDTGVELTYRPRASVRGRVVHRPQAGGPAVPVESFVIWTRSGPPPADDDFRGKALEGEEGEVVTSHPGGRFAIDGLGVAPGKRESYTLRVRAPGYAQLVRRGVLVSHGEDVDLGDLELAASAGLRVSVVEGRSTLPVEGARVFLAPSSSRSALAWWRARGGRPADSSSVVRYGETDGDGAVVLQAPSERPWALFVEADGFASGELVNLTGTEGEITVEITRGATVTAEVVDGAGEPLAGVEVDLRLERRGGPQGEIPPRVGRSNESGVALFQNVGAGRATVRVAQPRMRPRQPREWREVVEIVDVPKDGAVTVRLETQRSEVLRGRVRAGGVALPDARIRLAVREGKDLIRPETTSTTLRAIADSNGEFALRGIPTGTYEVTVNHRSRAMATVFTHRVGPEPAELLIDLAEAEVSGRLVYRGSGEPVAGVRIRVLGPSELHRAWVGQRTLRAERDGSMDARDDWLEPGSLRSGADGTFAFGGLTVGVPVRLEISGSLILFKRVNLQPFEAGDVREQVVIEVDAAASLTVVAGSSSGSGRRGRRGGQYGIRLRGLDEGGGVRSSKVVSRLRGPSHRFSSLAPGRYRVETFDLRADGAPAVEIRELSMKAGERASITMPTL